MSTKVLVADDESDFVELISFNLRQRGYEVFTAHNGFEAITRARNELPDVIVLDVVMPGINGFSVVQTLRQESTTGSIPILIYTERTEELPRLNGVDSGADDCLAKPFRIRDFLSRVEKLSHSRKPNPADETDYPQIFP